MAYIEKTIENGWSRNVLVMQIESHAHLRLGQAKTNFDMTLPKPTSDLARDIVKSEYNFEFLNLSDVQSLNVMRKKFDSAISILKATLDDYPCIQNMARFYVYDLSRDCGSISSDWAMPETGLYESFDFKNYFEESSKKAYLVKVYDEIAGFVLLDNEVKNPDNTINMGEFFIIAKFQGHGIGNQVSKEIWNMHPGKWEISVIPENKSALTFWEKTIYEFTCGNFNKQIKDVTYDEHCPYRIIFEFDTNELKI